MSKTFTLRSGILAMSLLAASGFAAAADDAPHAPRAGKQAQHRQFDPVAHTQRNLDHLAKKLNLQEEQKTAWQTYAGSAIARAKERTVKMQEWHSRKGEARADADTATRLDRKAQAMRNRADELQKVAQETRVFEAALSPEQKTIFDLYWKTRLHQRKGHRPLA
ncbi:MAG: Spy/CpxP family protein refolding chaperone [Prolixibacteraceae bacterium]|nr:Spy/CpxP family protein refolding chaperone [Burkholderiales bacterium]